MRDREPKTIFINLHPHYEDVGELIIAGDIAIVESKHFHKMILTNQQHYQMRRRIRHLLFKHDFPVKGEFSLDEFKIYVAKNGYKYLYTYYQDFDRKVFDYTLCGRINVRGDYWGTAWLWEYNNASALCPIDMYLVTMERIRRKRVEVENYTFLLIPELVDTIRFYGFLLRGSPEKYKNHELVFEALLWDEDYTHHEQRIAVYKKGTAAIVVEEWVYEHDESAACYAVPFKRVRHLVKKEKEYLIKQFQEDPPQGITNMRLVFYEGDERKEEEYEQE